MINKYSGPCNMCGDTVQSNMGSTHRAGRKWFVYCATCVPGGMPNNSASKSTATTFIGAGGASTVYQNRNGSCIDAPCCGCCTY